MKIGSALVIVGVALIAGWGLASVAGAGDLAGAVGGPVFVSPQPVPAVPTVRRRIVDRIVPNGTYPNNIVPGGFFALPDEQFGQGRPNRHRRSSASTLLIGPPPMIVTAPPGGPGYAGAPDYYGLDDPPPAAYSPPTYVPPIAYTPPIDAPARIAPAPPPPPPPSVVQYDTGRFELRGDGMAMPYTWVWIPNPPPPPPTGPPTLASPEWSRFPDGPLGRPGQLYRWTDDQGVMHLTDSLDKVPRKYREQVLEAPRPERSDPS